MKNLYEEVCLNGSEFGVESQNISIPFLMLFKENLQIKLSTQLALNSYLQSLMNEGDQVKKPEEENQESRHERVEEGQGTVQQQLRNETKNIPKNFGKAIISFIQNHQSLVKKLLAQENFSFQQYVSSLKSRKKYINSIADLRAIWLDEEFPYASVTRKVSLHFLKRGSLKYIFNSRIQNHKGHVKYRNRLIEVLKNPKDFTSMKTFHE